MRLIVSLFVALIAASGAELVYAFTDRFLIGVAAFVAIFGSFVIQGLRQIPAQPPTKGILTIFGRRLPKILNEGWNFFPIYPWVVGFIPVNVTKINQDLTPKDLRTPDLAEIEVSVSLTWTPSIEGDPTSLISFLNAGGEEGVKTILEDIVGEKLRIWAIATVEGPQTWREAVKAADEAVQILIAGVAGEALPADPTERAEAMGRIRRGNGVQPIPTLGITLNRLNVTRVKPKGELAKVAELQAKEEQERRGEVFEVGTDLMKAHQLIGAAAAAGQTLTIEDAFRIVMEWKATREGHGFTIPGISPTIAEIVKTILGRR